MGLEKKKVKSCASRQRQFNRTENEGKITIIIRKKYTKKLCAIQLLTTGWSMLSQFLSSGSLLASSFIAECEAIWYGILLWSVWVSCPGCVPSQLLACLQPPYQQGRVRSRKVLHSVNTALQKLKCQCNTNIILILKPEYRNIPVIRKKISCSPAKLRTICYLWSVNSDMTPSFSSV